MNKNTRIQSCDDQVTQALGMARKSTASIGKFTPKLVRLLNKSVIFSFIVILSLRSQLQRVPAKRDK